MRQAVCVCATDFSPSPPAKGGEGRGEEGFSAYRKGAVSAVGCPLPGPLPVRSSRGEGVLTGVKFFLLAADREWLKLSRHEQAFSCIAKRRSHAARIVQGRRGAGSGGGVVRLCVRRGSRRWRGVGFDPP